MTTQTSDNNKRIAKNTLMLYFRMMFLMLISLYTSRVILQTLGVEDYGIYNVVGGFVAFLAFLNGSISSSTSRFITFALGKGNMQNLKKVFSICLLTHLLIAVLLLVIAETVGLWFVMNKLIIPEDRMNAAIWVYQCSILSSLIMVWSVPYNACIIAHEKMSAFAYISIFEAVAKLIIVYILMIGFIDNLILYAILLLIVQLIIRYLYTRYCHKNFEESRTGFIWDCSLFKEILSFAGWNLWGNLAGALFTQGVNVILNMFFGPAVNAARGLAVQVQSAVQLFAVNFQTAINPQITKSFANGDIDYMHVLVCRSTKFTFYLLLCLSLPIMVRTDFILGIWLGRTPEFAAVFLKLMLIICIVDAMANPLMVSASATGKVKLYQSVIGGILLLIVPCAYVVLRLGGVPETVFYVHLVIVVIACIVRLYIIRPMIRLSIVNYIKNSIMPCLIVGTFATVLSIGVSDIMPMSSIGSLVTLVITFLISLVTIVSLGLTSSERQFLLEKALKILHK